MPPALSRPSNGSGLTRSELGETADIGEVVEPPIIARNSRARAAEHRFGQRVEFGGEAGALVRRYRLLGMPASMARRDRAAVAQCHRQLGRGLGQIVAEIELDPLAQADQRRDRSRSSAL